MPHTGMLLALLLVAGCSDDAPAQPADGGDDAPHQQDGAPLDGPTLDVAGDSRLADSAPPAPWSCPTYAAGVAQGTVTSAAVNEVSGIAVSQQNPGIVWVHNDSGDSARIFALDSSAALVAIYTLQGASAIDWEDMALAPGPGGKPHLYLADMGDNAEQRASITIYRVAEPQLPAGAQGAPVALSNVDALVLTYPDGAHNAETLLVDPTSQDLFILTKSTPAVLYRSPAPQAAGSTRELQQVATLQLPSVPVGGDLALQRDEILVKTYDVALLWHRPAGTDVAQALQATPCSVPLASEPQGEAIAFDPLTRDYVTLSEWTGQPLYRYLRR